MRQVFLALLFVLAAPTFAGTPLPDTPHIVVSGAGEVTAKPDSARLSFQFESRAAQPLPAKKAVDQGVNRLLEALSRFGIADGDIEAGSLQASEDVDYTDSGKRVSNGYEASRTVTVLLTRIDQLNDLIDTGLAAGATNFRNLQFESSRAAEFRAEAKRKAIQNAHAQARDTSVAFGAALGSIYSIDSITSQVEFGYRGRTLDAVTVTGSNASGRYVQPTVEYHENVRAVFELKR